MIHVNEEEIVEGVVKWCDSKSITKEGILILTVQRNRSTEFASVVVDFESLKLVPNYFMETDYNEMVVDDFLVCYKSGLKLPSSTSVNTSIHCNDGPFGCKSSEITSYKNRITAYDATFHGFMMGKGNYPNIVFEVKKQVDNGPLISTKWYKLENDKVFEVFGSYKQKVHCFKNYKCLSQNLFFAVDLYRADESKGQNFHHMRLHPYTKVNMEVLRSFFQKNFLVK